MKLGKLVEDSMVLVDVENGKEVGGKRTEEELIAEGYEPVCESEKPCPEAIATYEHIEGGWIQIWVIPQPEPENE